MSFKDVYSIFSSDGHFVQSNENSFTILIEGHPGDISVKLFWNRVIGLCGHAI